MNESKSAPAPARRGWLRKLVWLAGILVVLLVVAYFVVSSGAFIKGVVVPKVGAALNADLTVGDAAFSALSRLELRDVKLTPKGRETLFTASVVRARYGLFAILGGKIAVDEITVESPTITVIENADGTSNLDPLLKPAKAKTGEKKSPSTKTSEPTVMDVKMVTLNNATIRRVKHLKGGGRESLELANVTVTASNIKNSAAGKLDLSALLAMDKTAPAPAKPAAMQAKLNGTFTFDLTQDLKPANVKGNAAFAIEKATGDFADFAALAAKLDCDATPTEVKQLALRFTQANEALGELRISGPFDALTSEGHLNVAVLSLDRRVLNLFGAASGVDFGTTVLNSTNVIDLSKGGALITASGQLDAASVRITRQGQTTPTLDLKCGYDVTVDRTAHSALLQSLNLLGAQNGQPLLRVGLTSPMTVAFGGAAAEAGDAALNLSVTNLNLGDWKAFTGDAVPTGVANAQLKLLSQKGGKQLTFDFDSSLDKLSTRFGSNEINQADIRLTARGSAVDLTQFNLMGTNALAGLTRGREADLTQFKLEDYRLEVSQQGQTAVAVNGSGTFDSAMQNADLQVTVRATLTRLLAMLPQPDANLTGGTVELKGRVTSKQQDQSVVGQLTLANLNGQYATYRFTDFGSVADLDMAMKAKQLEIRKATGELRSAGNAGGKFEVTGNVNLATKAGQLALKLADFNQNGLRPFLESALGDKKLISVSVNSTASANFAANDDASVKADLQLANLVVKDPKGSLPSTPLEVKAQVDAGVAKSVAQIRQCQLTLTPTDRAKNELNLTGRVDFSQTNAMTGNLKLAADSLDVTRYYDLFGGDTKSGETPTTITTAAAPPSENKEPDPVKLPFRDFTFEAAIGRFYLREIDAQNVQLVAKLDGSRVLLKPAQLTLNGAPVTATADLDLSVPGYKYDVTFNANGIPVEPLANSFSPAYRGQANGRLIASANLKGTGVTGTNLRRTLNGGANFSFTNANIQIVGPKVKKILSPIALVLGAPELLNSPLRYVNATLRAGNGNIEIPAFTAHSDAFMAQSQGVIPIADVLTDSRLHQDIEVSLSRKLAEKLRFSNVPTNAAYMKLPTFVHLRGTLGSPDAKTDKAVILALTAGSIGGVVGGKAGGIIEGVGALFGGKPAPTAPTAPPATATNAPPANVQQPNPVNDVLKLFKKPKK